jgi:hypothetical protein
MLGLRTFAILAVSTTIISAFFCIRDPSFFAKAAAPTNACGTTAECAQAAAMSAKVTSDAEIAFANQMTAKQNELLAQIGQLRAQLAAIATNDTEVGHEYRPTLKKDDQWDCPPGQFVSHVEVHWNSDHPDGVVQYLIVHCRPIAPPKPAP